MSGRSIVILGAGPAGLGAALALARRGFEPRLIERASAVGGNAGSFELAGLRVDFGSHRLHPAADPEVLETLQALLGPDLLTRPRHGRIHLLGRWIHFPLRASDLALRVHPRFALGVGLDLARKLLPVSAPERETFASVLERGLGRTICRDFYFPYARKIWGLEPEEIASAQAHKRVSSATIAKLLRRLLPGGAGSGGAQSRGVFYYPRRGYGQISERLAEAARQAGARLLMETNVEQIRVAPDGAFELEGARAGERVALRADRVWSTIPAGLLVRSLDPPAPERVRASAGSLELRAMILVYLVIAADRFSEYDAHYFPSPAIPITRLSEPKNYAALGEPRGRTVVCAELPCSQSDDVWKRSDEELGDLVSDGLARAGLALPGPVLEVTTRRLPAAYPIYRAGYEEHFSRMDDWLDGVPGLLSFGRQGLFAHDNTHHALYMAFSAARCLGDDGSFDDAQWQRYRAIFETHVVED